MIYQLEKVKGKYLLQVRTDKGDIHVFTFNDIVDSVDKILEYDMEFETTEKGEPIADLD